jgi:hypothetical protein
MIAGNMVQMGHLNNSGCYQPFTVFLLWIYKALAGSCNNLAL